MGLTIGFGNLYSPAGPTGAGLADDGCAQRPPGPIALRHRRPPTPALKCNATPKRRLRHLIHTLDGADATKSSPCSIWPSSTPVLAAARRSSARRSRTVAVVLRAQHAHARVVQLAAQRLGADVVNLDCTCLLSREGRDGARYDLHAAGHAGGYPRDARCGAGLAGVRREVRRAACLYLECRRGAFVTPNARVARRAHGQASVGRLRQAQSFDCRRHQPLARRPLRLACVHGARRRGAPHPLHRKT